MDSPMSLSGRSFIVTGASSGIGRTAAILISQWGGRVVLVGRNEERLHATLAAMQGNEHRIKPFDLSHTEEIAGWMMGVAKEFGVFDGVVHCAGIERTKAFRFESAVAVEEMMKINVYAAFFLFKGFQQKKIGRPGGSLLVVSSIAGLVGQPGHAAYSTSKAALAGMVRSMAVELAPEKTRVNCIAPGIVRTEMVTAGEKTLTSEQIEALYKEYPLGIGTPEDVANAIAFMLSDASRWITGTTLVVDGGFTCH